MTIIGEKESGAGRFSLGNVNLENRIVIADDATTTTAFAGIEVSIADVTSLALGEREIGGFVIVQLGPTEAGRVHFKNSPEVIMESTWQGTRMTGILAKNESVYLEIPGVMGTSRAKFTHTQHTKNI